LLINSIIAAQKDKKLRAFACWMSHLAGTQLDIMLFIMTFDQPLLIKRHYEPSYLLMFFFIGIQ